MIHIFFVPGTFGTTVEFLLRNFTKEYNPVPAQILSDGSMHSLTKERHIIDSNDIASSFESISTDTIFTPIYPFEDKHLSEILEVYMPLVSKNDKFLQLYTPDPAAGELNMIFQYRKIVTGHLNHSLSVICGNNVQDIKNWGEYSSWAEMQSWELREWLSLFYATWINEWCEVNDKLYPIKNTDILFNTANTFQHIIAHCGLTVSSAELLANFVNEWRSKQQYIVDEFDLVNSIHNAVTNNKLMTWDSSALSIVSEAIIQKRLRDNGYEIKCSGLNEFPNNTETLYSLLEKV